ncbi:MAG: exodeoxyribonuclease VII large subunit [bacterium]|nr:exodeoxyribonuclease VII large subunit [bacterium]
MIDERFCSVSDFVQTMNAVLGESWDMSYAVEGEVSGYRVSRGQWVSFDLKDEDALINIFLPVWNLQIPVEDGMRVRVYGKPRIYPKFGKFSLSAERIVPAGEGELKKALQALRACLESEGLFDPSRKRELPRFPERVAFIGSKESAAYGDFVRILGERWGGMTIDVYHVLVQGERAPKQIISAIHSAQEGTYDALVMSRGGGSFEDLMAFNDEGVARAIHASKIPTLVAIGHERDVTLAEEVADVRASTPTDCARRLVLDRRDVLYELQVAGDTIDRAILSMVEKKKGLLTRAVSAPSVWLRTHQMNVKHLATRTTLAFEQWFGSFTDRLEIISRMMTSFDPKAVLKRGYSIIRGEDGKGVSSTRDLRLLQKVTLTLADGDAEGTITKI